MIIYVYPSGGAAAIMHRVDEQEFDKAACALARDFLLRSGAARGVTPELIEKYLHLSIPRPESLAGLYERMLESAQSANMKAGVIGGSIGGGGGAGGGLWGVGAEEGLGEERLGWGGGGGGRVAQIKTQREGRGGGGGEGWLSGAAD